MKKGIDKNVQNEQTDAALSKSLISLTTPMQGFPANGAACGEREQMKSTVPKQSAIVMFSTQGENEL